MSPPQRGSSLGQTIRRGRQLRRIGLWDVEPWQPTPDATAKAVKRFTWTTDAIAIATGEPIVLRYYTEAHASAAELEDLTALAAREADARQLLERAVANAIGGVGYVAVPKADDYVNAAAVALIEFWAAKGDFPDYWRERLAEAIRAGHQQYREAVGWAQGLGAAIESDPVLATFGWRIGIRPLTLKASCADLR